MGTLTFQIFLSFLVLFLPFQGQKPDSIDAIAGFLKGSDSRSIASFFAPIIEMNILSEENEYSKAQAELILRDFLLKNKPITLKILHRLNSNPNYRFAVFSVQSVDNKFRISISMAKDDDSFHIKVIRIEYDKEQY
jgi:hypothetical protein